MGCQLNNETKRKLGLQHRSPPEFYESADEALNSNHAGAIRNALVNIGISGIFCVQEVPTVAFLQLEEAYDQTKIHRAHSALWNQGLASLLVVLYENDVHLFSLAKRTTENIADFTQSCLIDVLDLTADILSLEGLLYGAESGRLWKQHEEYFYTSERVDSVLLSNLCFTHRSLCNDGLPSDQAQALLMQSMFISYLEDRQIISPSYFSKATEDKYQSYSALLKNCDIEALHQLFTTLENDFNGDLFVAPCSFEKTTENSLISKHLATLYRFRNGKEVMEDNYNQLRFWGYDFRFIPIELISAVYDRFLGENEKKRKELGAYYTPMFLADTVVSHVWAEIDDPTSEECHFLDPSCGSGVFLVRTFQRLCEEWRSINKTSSLDWEVLCRLVNRVHGWDINDSAVRVAAFSLYIALLEQVSPPDIEKLIQKGHILPQLWGSSLVHQDFFKCSPETSKKYSVIIGNPPWSSRKGQNRSSVEWCKSQSNLPIPSNEDAWAFTWKSLDHINGNGLIAFLLPAMGFLHNTSNLSALKALLRETFIKTIINFSDLRFQLFDGAIRPTALITFTKNTADGISPYRFEYWVPKADLNLRLKRTITLSSQDKKQLRSDEVIKDPTQFKQLLWMQSPEIRLFKYLDNLPKLKNLLEIGDGSDDAWEVGQGFQPHTNPTQKSYESTIVNKLPFLDVNNFSRFCIYHDNLSAAHSSPNVRRLGFEKGFDGKKILVPRGVQTSRYRLRAAYTDYALTFTDTIIAIKCPAKDENLAKLFTGFMNSKLALWFAFNGTSSFGSERPEVKKNELIKFPLPKPEDLPEPEKSESAKKAVIKCIDKLSSNEISFLNNPSNFTDNTLIMIDKLIYEYFCLSENEIHIIEDYFNYIIPASQPSKAKTPAIWKDSTPDDRSQYAQLLKSILEEWVTDEGLTLNTSLEAKNHDLCIFKLSLVPENIFEKYHEKNNSNLNATLSRLAKVINQPLHRNIQVRPDLKVFIGNELYLIKPLQKRFWLKTSAMSDANALLIELQKNINNSSIQGS